jgi:hypothetical protein
MLKKYPDFATFTGDFLRIVLELVQTEAGEV